MEVKREIIEVIPQELAEPVGGARPEPEEMPARRILEVDADVTGQTTGESLGKFNTRIVSEESTLTLAQMSGKHCENCLHWNHDLWQRAYVQKFHDPNFNRELNKIRRRLDVEGDEQEAQIKAMGFCAAFGEILQDEIVTHPLSCCPSTDQKGEPMPLMFTPKDAASKRLVDAVYDKTLKMATVKRRR